MVMDVKCNNVKHFSVLFVMSEFLPVIEKEADLLQKS